MRVLIVDDHILIRKGIKLLLEYYIDIKEIIEAGNGSEAISLAIKHQPDIILMDLSMPDGLDGFTASKTILSEVKDTKIILLTMHDEEIYVRKAIQYQIHGYLLKNSEANELHDAIQAVLNGKRFYKTKIPDEQLKRLMMAEVPQSVLTQREQEVVRLTSLGFTNVQTGQQLGISPKTVENHKSNIMQKLSLKDKHEFMKYALKNNLVDLF
ncbi:chemotaxis protein CheY [Heyndrickxia shackletonii]|uniref:Chemotaxis protein CheY n=1 Tax=Heyndrickxia shackletonii TaxID=157838 RepID=A0A0Q3TFU2_9BACI|nr:response regulator transcription factor [Heyndrickxia shackletonii]KQL52505.1 chemotaxis protein CheY [Heyndrickxia shackletonii]NEZ02351.1 response regulator transcription factor [Heyndrickxia shackletonii]